MSRSPSALPWSASGAAPGLGLLLLLLLAACSGPPDRAPADLVLRGGLIHTSDPERPAAEALAVRDGRFVFVGDRRQSERWIGEGTEVLELEGAAALPGLIDGHVHLESGVPLVRGVDLTGIADRGEWTRRIAARAAELGPGGVDRRRPLGPHALAGRVPDGRGPRSGEPGEPGGAFRH